MPPLPLSRRARIIAAAAVGVVVLCILASMLAQRPATLPEVIAEPIAPPPPVEAAPPVLDAKSATILELFSPSDIALTRQMNETEMTQRIERMFISSFMLVHCERMSTREYHETYAALAAYVREANLVASEAEAHARLQKIAESANLSYQLVYDRTACNNPQLPTLLTQLRHWRTEYVR